MKIYALSEFGNGICGYFANLAALTKYLAAKKPIDNKFVSLDSGTAGEYVLDKYNLNYIIEQTNITCGNNYTASSIFIDVDFIIKIIRTQYLISTIDVIE